MKTLLVLLLLALVAGCAAPKDPGLPPGYGLLCSKEGKFTITIPPSGNISVSVWDTAMEAKEFAWYYEEWRKRPIVFESSKYHWDQCPDMQGEKP